MVLPLRAGLVPHHHFIDLIPDFISYFLFETQNKFSHSNRLGFRSSNPASKIPLDLKWKGLRIVATGGADSDRKSSSLCYWKLTRSTTSLARLLQFITNSTSQNNHILFSNHIAFVLIIKMMKMKKKNQMKSFEPNDT
ncbi:hypothetical protein F3Y22_tig00116959pilonHSYRG00485 [Hibiscus syriacus]|uniref:Uncharacterized protein n=1 Tax=Hibiscus syriacus TaxID=106335 RepID=A0A6A2XUV5_HIBSY|nr:hypothetical protein F3Y22_tig00116959pilonHSYRG00485 [Hibiscus syriacus]